jgi:hypothetical protein
MRGAMESRNESSALYRGLTVIANPSGISQGALTDAFFILQATANPMYAVTLYELSANEINLRQRTRSAPGCNASGQSLDRYLFIQKTRR